MNVPAVWGTLIDASKNEGRKFHLVGKWGKAVCGVTRYRFSATRTETPPPHDTCLRCKIVLRKQLAKAAKKDRKCK